MMKKFIIVIFSLLFAFGVRADYDGCEALTAEEVAKSQEIMKSAKKIVLSIDESEHNFEEFKFIDGLIYLKDQSYGAEDIFVQFSQSETYINLGYLVGCRFQRNFVITEYKGNFPTFEKRIEKVKNNFKKCESGLDDNLEVEFEERQYSYQVRNDIYRIYACYQQAMYDMFDEFKSSSTDKLKRNFDNYMEAYSIIFSDTHCTIVPFSCGTMVEDERSVMLLSEIRKLAESYLYTLEQELLGKGLY